MKRIVPLFFFIVAAACGSSSDGGNLGAAGLDAGLPSTSSGESPTTTESNGDADGGPSSDGGGPSLPGLATYAAGTNLSGLEYASAKLPGRVNTDYTAPKNAEIDYFIGKGLRFLRIPFLWERMQSSLGGPLESDYLALVDAVVDYATSKGATVLVDPHNYARYRGKVIGATIDGAATAAQFGDLWAKLAKKWSSNEKVVFGLMNEPHDMDTKLWLADANAAIEAIRATGARNLITVPGNHYTGAHSWTTSDNANVMIGVEDPLDNWIYEVHQYFDEDSSGTSSQCPSKTIGADALTKLSTWLRTNHERAMLGEFGVANDATCLGALDNLLKHMDDNRDIYAGYTYWTAGPWSGSYMFSIEPKNATEDAPQMRTLLAHL